MSDQSPRQSPDVEAAAAGAQIELRIVPPDYSGVPALYANYMQGTVSQHDFTLYLGWYAIPPLNEPPTAPVDVPVRPVATVTIPLQILEALVRVLQAQAAAYEANTGQPLPKEGRMGKAEP